MHINVQALWQPADPLMAFRCQISRLALGLACASRSGPLQYILRPCLIRYWFFSVVWRYNLILTFVRYFCWDLFLPTISLFFYYILNLLKDRSHLPPLGSLFSTLLTFAVQDGPVAGLPGGPGGAEKPRQWEQWKPASPEAAQTPRSLVPPACFPPGPAGFASYRFVTFERQLSVYLPFEYTGPFSL